MSGSGIRGLSPMSAQQVCAWLNTLDGTKHDARPLRLKIGRTIYPSGAQYTDNVGETVIYLLGPLPKAYTGRKHLFAITGTEADDKLWYVSGYFPGRPEDAENPQFKQYHPFGRMFMLRRSDVPVKRLVFDWEMNVKHRWLTHGDRGGLRPVMNVTRIWLDKPDIDDQQTERDTGAIEHEHQGAPIMNPYEMALACQDAVNLSGIVKDWARQLDAVWAEARKLGGGTEYVNTHPTTLLILDKLITLSGVRWSNSDQTVADAYRSCQYHVAHQADLVSESHTINADGSETHTATFKLPELEEGDIPTADPWRAIHS